MINCLSCIKYKILIIFLQTDQFDPKRVRLSIFGNSDNKHFTSTVQFLLYESMIIVYFVSI